MTEVLRITLPFFGLILIGYLAGRGGRISEEALGGLRFLVFYCAMPALFFQLVAETPVRELAAWSFVGTTTFATYCAFAFAFSLGALVNGGNVQEATIQGLVGSKGNIGYLGPALAVSAFGSAAGAPIALIFSFDYALLAILVPVMMGLGGTERSKVRAATPGVIRQILLHPFILATIVGFLASLVGFAPPAPVEGFLVLLRSAAAPAALFLAGASLAVRPPGRFALDLPFLVAIKLAVHPAIVYLLLSWIGGFDRIWVHTAVLVAALPPTLDVLRAARQYGVYVERGATGILLGMALSVVTLAVALYLLVNDLLPIDFFS